MNNKNKLNRRSNVMINRYNHAFFQNVKINAIYYNRH